MGAANQECPVRLEDKFLRTIAEIGAIAIKARLNIRIDLKYVSDDFVTRTQRLVRVSRKPARWTDEIRPVGWRFQYSRAGAHGTDDGDPVRVIVDELRRRLKNLEVDEVAHRDGIDLRDIH
jgi:hypothetical protein